jgi:Flp pilus assembly secretin CpaC
MNFKQTAALGFSALLLGGAMALPNANAASIGFSAQNESQRHLVEMVDNHLLIALAQHEPMMQTPIPPEKHGFFGWLNPFGHTGQSNARHVASSRRQPVAPAATSLPMGFIPEQIHAMSTPVKQAIAEAGRAVNEAALESSAALGFSSAPSRKHKKARHLAPQGMVTAAVTPVHPVITINPIFAVSANPVNGALGKKGSGISPIVTVVASPQSPLASLPAASLAKSGVKSEEAPVALLAANGDLGPALVLPSNVPSAQSMMQPLVTLPEKPALEEMHSSDSSEVPALKPAQPKTVAAKPAAKPHHTVPTAHQLNLRNSAIQMLSANPMERMLAFSQGAGMHYAPGLDNGSPDINLSNTPSGSVKVLKSGISQKMNSIDLAIGKAEVLYLSRPATRISVSNPDVAAAVIISPTQIQLTGKAVGVANLLVWGDMSSPDHTVVDISVHRDVSVLVNQLKYVDPGIQIVPMAAEDTVILTGQAETRESAQLAIEMAKAFFAKAGGNVGAGPLPGGGGSGPNSQAPGSAQPGMSTNVINLMKIKGEPSTKLELVRQRMQTVDPNVHIEVVPGPDGGEKVILTGRVASASIASKALNLASVFYGQPGMKMVTSQGGNQYVKMSVSSGSSSTSGGSSSSSSSSSPSGADSSGGANLLQGSIMTDATGNVISMLEIAQKPQIRCTIKFLELNKTALNALGGTLTGVQGATKIASWSGVQSAAPGKGIAVLDSQSPPGSSFSTTSSRTGTGSQGWSPQTQNFAQSFREVYQNGITQAFTINNRFAGAIQALQERRQVRTLAEPTLTMLSGEQGSFLAGGEIPIAFVGGQGQVSIQYKEFGIRLNLLPIVTDDGKIQMQVAPEISSLDAANGVSTNSISVPAFVSRKMNTTLLVEQGQSFILAGLYNQQDTNSMSRFPGLGSVPVVGSFFRNTWKNKNSSEMVVVIKPEVIYSNTGVTSPAPVSEAPGSPAEVSNQ